MHKLAMSQSSLSSFALRLISSNIDPGNGIENSTENIVGGSEEETNMHAHVLGIFVSLDTDRDGLITRPQLLQGIQLLGLRPTERLLRNFEGRDGFSSCGSNSNVISSSADDTITPASSSAATDTGTATAATGTAIPTATATPTATPTATAATATTTAASTNTNTTAPTAAVRRSSVLMSVEDRVRQGKIDANTFAKVVMEEWKRVRHTLKSNLDPLFAFAHDGEITGQGDAALLTSTALKHMLQGIQVSTKLNDKDYASFLELLPADAEGNVSVKDLKKVLYE